jgi:hypothetical protein
MNTIHNTRTTINERRIAPQNIQTAASSPLTYEQELLRLQASIDRPGLQLLGLFVSLIASVEPDRRDSTIETIETIFDLVCRATQRNYSDAIGIAQRAAYVALLRERALTRMN